MENTEFDKTLLQLINNYINISIRQNVIDLITAIINMGNPTIDSELIASIDEYDLSSSEIGNYIINYIKTNSVELLRESGIIINNDSPLKIHLAIYITIYAMTHETIVSNSVIADDSKNDVEKLCTLISSYTDVDYSIAYTYVDDITPTIFENIVKENSNLIAPASPEEDALINHTIELLNKLLRINSDTPKTLIGRSLSQFEYDATFNSYIPYINSINNVAIINPNLYASEIYNILYVSNDTKNNIITSYDDFIEENYLSELDNNKKEYIRNMIIDFENKRKDIDNE